MSDGEWDALEERIQMRLIACFYEDRNSEKKRMVLATTLLDTQKYDWIEILNLYATRWEIELRLRDLKTTMKMEALNVKTPEMAKKSLAMTLLGYNLVKAVSQETSQSEGVELKLISFKGGLDWISSTTSLFHEIKRPRFSKISMPASWKLPRPSSLIIVPIDGNHEQSRSAPNPFQDSPNHDHR